MRYTKETLDKLENIFELGGYKVRYEKGNFRSGACLVKGLHVIVVNKHFTSEGKINSLIEILKEIDQNTELRTLISEELQSEYKKFLKHEN
jgi:galactitol-specific phosphotransferase system IIB component